MNVKMAEWTAIQPQDIIFEEKLAKSQLSTVFLVLVRDFRCVMKVHHGRGPRKYYEEEGRELDLHVREAAAYRRFKECDLCDRGIVPKFYGTLDKFDPEPYQPHLREFLGVEYPPSAIFLEYIPNIKSLDVPNYTTERMDRLVAGLLEIHKAFVLHLDVYPRNMFLALDDTPGRVLWMDFNMSEIFERGSSLSAEDQYEFDLEAEVISDIKNCFEADVKLGKRKQTISLFC